MIRECIRCGEISASLGDVDCTYCRDHTQGSIAIAWLQNIPGPMAGALMRLAQCSKSDSALWLKEAVALFGEDAVFEAVRGAASWPDEIVAKELMRGLGVKPGAKITDQQRGDLRVRIMSLEADLRNYGPLEGMSTWLVRRRPAQEDAA